MQRFWNIWHRQQPSSKASSTESTPKSSNIGRYPQINEIVKLHGGEIKNGTFRN